MMGRRPPEEDPASIGNVLVEMGLLTEHQLKQIVIEFKASKEELLGQFIVRKTPITEDQVELAFLRQQKLRGNGK